MGSVAMGLRFAGVDVSGAGAGERASRLREEPTICDRWCLFQTEGAWLGQLGIEALAGPRTGEARGAYERASQSVEHAVREAHESGALNDRRARAMCDALAGHRAAVLARSTTAAAAVDTEVALREAFAPPRALRPRVEALAGVAPWPSRVAPSLPWSASVSALA